MSVHAKFASTNVPVVQSKRVKIESYSPVINQRAMILKQSVTVHALQETVVSLIFRSIIGLFYNYVKETGYGESMCNICTPVEHENVTMRLRNVVNRSQTQDFVVAQVSRCECKSVPCDFSADAPPPAAVNVDTEDDSIYDDSS